MSVLISTYNRPALLMKAVASARGQTLRDLEVIVRDDAGDSDMGQALAELGDERVRYRRNDKNLGDCGTNILLYGEAEGRYVAHLDDDDEWEPQFLARLVEPLELNPDVPLAFCNSVVIDDEGRPQWGRTYERERRWGRAGLIRGLQFDGRRLAAVDRAIPTGHAAVIRRSALDLGALDPRAGRAWDMQTATLAVRANGLAWFEPQRLARYRVHIGQMSDFLKSAPRTDDTFTGLLFCLARFSEDPLFESERPELLHRLAEQRTNWALALLAAGRVDEALDQARAAHQTGMRPRAMVVRAAARLARDVPGIRLDTALVHLDSSRRQVLRLRASVRARRASGDQPPPRDPRRGDRSMWVTRLVEHRRMWEAFAVIPLPLRRHLLFLWYHRRLGRFGHPRTFNEKVNWRIIHDRRERLAWTCDKLRVKAFATDLGIDVPRTIWSGTDVSEIGQLALPPAWVLKPNNRSGLVLFGHGSVAELDAIKQSVDRWSADSRVTAKGEWAYTQAAPNLVLEERIGPVPGSPTDFKVYVFDGEPAMILVDVDRFGRHRSCFYSPEWQLMSFRDRVPPSGELMRPLLLSRMLDAAREIAAGFDFLRVDFYLEDDRVYLGELTPYPGGGLEPLKPRRADRDLGDAWKLPALDIGKSDDGDPPDVKAASPGTGGR